MCVCFSKWILIIVHILSVESTGELHLTQLRDQDFCMFTDNIIMHTSCIYQLLTVLKQMLPI